MAAAATTDRLLLSDYVATRGEETFRALVQRHGPDVLRICRWILKDIHEAEDAFQATFLLLMHKAPTIQDPDLLDKWLRGSAYRIATRARRHSLRRSTRERKRAEMSTTQSVSEPIEHDLSRILRDELDQLPDHYRAPLILCYLEGFSHQETAEQLKWPTGTVKTRLTRARNLLRERLERRGVALGAGLLFLFRSDASAQALPADLVESTVHAMTAALKAANHGWHSPLAHGQSTIPPSVASRYSIHSPMLESLGRFPWTLGMIATFLISLAMFGIVGFRGSASQPPPLTDIPPAWLAPNLVNVLAVDCKE